MICIIDDDVVLDVLMAFILLGSGSIFEEKRVDVSMQEWWFP
jgi:hypothetical protein